MKRTFVGLMLAAAVTLAGCTSMGMNSVVKISDLSKGMTQAEVTEALGVQPSGSRVKDGRNQVRYTLHQNWKGFVPYYMTFDDNGKLESWAADEAEYQADQKAMGKAFGLDENGKPAGSSGGTAAKPAGPNDPALMNWIAGSYMSYKGQTHKRFILRANGTFTLTSSSSYSGREGEVGGVWGAASDSGNSGRWAISGTKAAGTITMNYNNGKQHVARYQAGSENGVFLFDGVTFAYEGPAK